MAKNIDILDSVNQKYNNGTSGLTATNAQDAVDELAARPIGGDVVGQGTSIHQNVPIYDGTTGKIIEDSGINAIDLVTLIGSNQYSLVSEKVSPDGTDLLLLECSAEGGAKRRVQISNIGGDLTDAVFPTTAGFQNQGSTAAQGPAGTTNINFSTSNKHALTGTTDTTIGTFTFPQANAHYSLLVPSTITINGVSAIGKTQYGQADLTAGKAHVMSIYYDGTTAHWQMSEEP